MLKAICISDNLSVEFNSDYLLFDITDVLAKLFRITNASDGGICKTVCILRAEECSETQNL
jgi:hypothetical protein